MGIVIGILYLAFVIFLIASMWTVFTKAGKPGWAAIVPIYNIIVLLEIVGRPTWWIILMLIPIVNFIVLIIVMHNLSVSFGKGGGFTVGLILLGFVFLPILAFGDAKYVGPAAKTA
jgi:Family of unknown function (DUF5684)